MSLATIEATSMCKDHLQTIFLALLLYYNLYRVNTKNLPSLKDAIKNTNFFCSTIILTDILNNTKRFTVTIINDVPNIRKLTRNTCELLNALGFIQIFFLLMEVLQQMRSLILYIYFPSGSVDRGFLCVMGVVPLVLF